MQHPRPHSCDLFCRAHDLDYHFLLAQSIFNGTSIDPIMKKINGVKKIRSVDQYLTILKAAGKSAITLRNYRQILSQYARFLGVPLERLHEHLNTDDLVRYSSEVVWMRETGRKSHLSTIHRYMELNGVEFDELEYNAAKVKVTEERDDKPLTTTLLQKMMDQGNPHSRAIISFLISTGCRAGETSKLLLSDVGRIENSRFVADITGDVINVRNEIAKRKKGGLVFLTAEAREYLTIWLKNRDRFIVEADRRTAQLYTGNTYHESVPRKGIGKPIRRPDNDQRLFAVSYSSLDKTFGRLYDSVDGEQGKSGAKITAHSCRAFFRTNAVKTIGIDLAEGILRHTGYLNAAYVRMTPEERYKQFREGEMALYITRADHRIQSGKLAELERENQELRARVEATPQIGDLDALRAQMKEMQEQMEKLSLAHGKAVADELIKQPSKPETDAEEKNRRKHTKE